MRFIPVTQFTMLMISQAWAAYFSKDDVIQGKSTFTQVEIQKIKELLRKKNNVLGDKQKSPRASLRRMGFYISDFGPVGFTEQDLEMLIQQKRIQIIDG